MPWLSASADGQGLCSKKKAVILKAWNKKDQTIMKCQRQKNEQRGYRMIYCVEDERNIRELLVYYFLRIIGLLVMNFLVSLIKTIFSRKDRLFQSGA